MNISDEKGNVRFSTDKSKVKNTEPKQIPQSNANTEQPSAIIIEMINKAEGIDTLKDIWETYPNYQRNQPFKKAISNAKAKFELQPES